MSYNRDTEVELKGTFTDLAGAAVDPTDVELQVLDPSGAATTYTYGASQVTKESVGTYKRAQVLDKTGSWYYRFKGTGTVKVANWKRLDVIDDPLG